MTRQTIKLRTLTHFTNMTDLHESSNSTAYLEPSNSMLLATLVEKKCEGLYRSLGQEVSNVGSRFGEDVTTITVVVIRR